MTKFGVNKFVYITIGLKKSYRSSSSHHSHTVGPLCNQFNHVFAVVISMPRFKSNNLYQTRPKIMLLLQKHCKIFERWGLCLQTPNGLPAAGLRPHTQKHSPLIANFWFCTWLVVSTRNANALNKKFLVNHKYKKVGA